MEAAGGERGRSLAGCSQRGTLLPQKMLLPTSSANDMLPNRDQIGSTAWLGLGDPDGRTGNDPGQEHLMGRTTAGWKPTSSKDGWKNFFDEDVPGPLGPADILPAGAVDRVYLVPVNVPAST